ncbi:MAG TPA: isoprenylcysteine carboxylmethyltransferase family protein [Arenicellales bacterium]|nr:isoprenylcysteine carboxylmethyltransferase family protein [Arenicellales bacterium]
MLLLLFSFASYGIFLLVFLYLLAFLANLQTTALADAWPALMAWIPYSIDAGRQPGPLATALPINIGLIALFGLQHSIMARQGFKAAWTRIVPREAERSIYVLLSSVVLVILMWLWQPMPEPAVWHADAAWTTALAWSVMIAGIGILLLSTFLIDHFDLFGLRQAWTAFTQRTFRHPEFRTPLFYKWVRHPLYVGWFCIFWGTPHMSIGHLLFAAGMTGYIFIAIQYEERDLVSFHGEAYQRYRQEVPMVMPMPGRKHAAPVRGSETSM